MSTDDLDGANGAFYSNERNAHCRTPLLINAGARQASIKQRIVLLLQDWWLWELLSALIALFATVAIITILVLYDGSPLPDWPSAFTVRKSINSDALSRTEYLDS